MGAKPLLIALCVALGGCATAPDPIGAPCGPLKEVYQAIEPQVVAVGGILSDGMFLQITADESGRFTVFIYDNKADSMCVLDWGKSLVIVR